MEIKDFEHYTLYQNGEIKNQKNQKYLTPYLGKSKYYKITVSKNNKRKQFYLHRLIAIHFIPNPNNYKEVDHIDKNPLNNNIENLRWCDHFINNQNKKFKKTNKLKQKHICKHSQAEIYNIQICRYKLHYFKSVKTLEEAIIQRDLMLSMFTGLTH